MSGIEMKRTEQAHTYPSQPPPYSGPPPIYNQPMMQPGPTTVIHPGTTTVIHSPAVVPGAPTIVVANQMSPNPTVFICPSCNQQIVTRVEHKPSMRTHLFALLLCVIGCWPCMCLPYCVDSCNNADHYCPNCNSYLGSYAN